MALPLQPVPSSDESCPGGDGMIHSHVLTKGVAKENHYGKQYGASWHETNYCMFIIQVNVLEVFLTYNIKYLVFEGNTDTSLVTTPSHIFQRMQEIPITLCATFSSCSC